MIDPSARTVADGEELNKSCQLEKQRKIHIFGNGKLTHRFDYSVSDRLAGDTLVEYWDSGHQEADILVETSATFGI